MDRRERVLGHLSEQHSLHCLEVVVVVSAQADKNLTLCGRLNLIIQLEGIPEVEQGSVREKALVPYKIKVGVDHLN